MCVPDDSKSGSHVLPYDGCTSIMHFDDQQANGCCADLSSA